MSDHQHWINEAVGEARKALCRRSRCGAVVVAGEQIIGRGFNAPPGDDPTSAMCATDLRESPKPKSDRTCCVHAEWRAIIDALMHHPDSIKGATLYFSRADESGHGVFSGQPYCTVCSRLALDVGLAYFALNHESGLTLYDCVDYNRRSYAYHQE